MFFCVITFLNSIERQSGTHPVLRRDEHLQNAQAKVRARKLSLTHSPDRGAHTED